MENEILRIRDLHTSFFTRNGEVKAVNGVSLDVPPASVVGIVGESGCGKSMTARSIMGLVKYPGRVAGGSIELCSRELVGLSDREMCRLRGDEMSMIFQEPMTSLNPVVPVGKQVEEAVLLHRKVSRAEARSEALRMFERVGIPEPEKRLRAYPHELSGGLRQRVMIAMAMVCRPKLLIADEPTTALDVTVQAQILKLMRSSGTRPA
jgi:peptide/nickel transport system ATP-binding protein